jgi:hypothetical protein
MPLEVTFESFSFTEACQDPVSYANIPNGPTEPLREWKEEQEHQMARSVDGVPILVHLPGGFSQRAHVSINFRMWG